MTNTFIGLLSLFLAGSFPAAGDATQRAIELFQQQDYRQSRQILEQVVKQQPRDPVANYTLGRVYFRIGRYKRSIRFMKRAVTLAPRQADYHYWLGRAYGERAKYVFVFRQAALAPKIRAAFERAVALDPNHVRARFGLVNFYLKAPKFMGGGVDKAKEQVQALDRLGGMASHLARALYLEKTRDVAGAESLYKKHITATTGSDQIRVYHQYGEFLIGRRRYQAARAIIKQLIALAPECTKSYELLGDVAAAAGDDRRAAAQYQLALKIDPYNREARFKLVNLNGDSW